MTKGPGSLASFASPRARRRWLVQLGLLILVGMVASFLGVNAWRNLAAQGIGSGFAFLGRSAGFDVSQALIDFPESSTYGRVLLVGLLNTAAVAAVTAVCATVLGVGVGLLSLAPGFLPRAMARAYVEVMRNLPPLFHVFFWYVVLMRSLPVPRESWTAFGMFFLNIQGLYLPAFVGGGLEAPMLDGFGFSGGIRLAPEFFVLAFALTLYTAGFIAEVVRAGVQSIPRGQVDAATALGLRPFVALRFVVAPQALRLIVPPLTSQYLNLFKNSSLAVAIGYPDLTALFAGITLNQTGQAIEVIGITMACYLAISLATSLVMNEYNRRLGAGWTAAAW